LTRPGGIALMIGALWHRRPGDGIHRSHPTRWGGAWFLLGMALALSFIAMFSADAG
jgi:hypothetical protein